MEDDKIKDLFKDFQPDLSSSSLFMSRLKRSMEAVEIVKEQAAQDRRRSRIALVVAAISGFAAGVVFTLLFPTLCAWISSISLSLPSIGLSSISINSQLISWLITAAACVFVSTNAYDLTLALYKRTKA